MPPYRPLSGVIAPVMLEAVSILILVAIHMVIVVLIHVGILVVIPVVVVEATSRLLRVLQRLFRARRRAPVRRRWTLMLL